MKSILIPIERIQQKIFFLRGQKIIFDKDLAEFYQVTTFNLNKAILRNQKRFPADFMFQLTLEEVRELEKEFGNIRKYGGTRILPHAFTEQGVAMLSAVLKSERAVIVSVQIMRSFVKLRELLLSNEALARKLKTIEARTDEHAQAIIKIIQELQKPTTSKKRRIGF